MSVIQRTVSVAANAVEDNILAGSAFEILRGRSIVSIGITGAAAGLVGTVQVGSTVVLEESPLFVKATYPTIPDEMFYNAAGVGNDRLVVRIRNTTAGALVCKILAQVTLV